VMHVRCVRCCSAYVILQFLTRVLYINQFPEAVPVPGIMILRIEEALTFTNMSMLKEMMWRLEQLGNISAHPTDPYSPDNTIAIILGESKERLRGRSEGGARARERER
jgi:hypothetical protein